MIELPDLPPSYDIEDFPVNYPHGLVIEAHVIDYGRACAKAAIEQAAKVCDDLADAYKDLSKHTLLTTSGKTVHQGMYGGAMNCASAIRNMIGEIK